MAKDFTWEDNYKLGIEIIDGQHKRYFEIVDELYESISDATLKPELGKIFDEFIEYHNIHFATEEQYFDAFKYEGAEKHKEAHRMFNQKLAEFQAMYKDGKTDIGTDLADFLEDWLVGHIAIMDKQYVQCFHDNGLY